MASAPAPLPVVRATGTGYPAGLAYPVPGIRGRNNPCWGGDPSGASVDSEAHRRSAMRKATSKAKAKKGLKVKNLPAKGRKAASVKGGGLATRAGGEVISAD